MRLRPASSAAARNPLKRRWPASPSDPIENAIASSLKYPDRMAAPAPLNVLWPDVYVGNGGVVRSDVHFVFGTVASLASRSAWWMAVFGRHIRKRNLQSQQQMLASARARFKSANSRAFSARVSLRLRDTSWAIKFQCPGGVQVPDSSFQNRAISVWSALRVVLSIPP